MVDSTYKMGKNCYSEVFLEYCKYIRKERKITRYIADNLEISSDDSDKENSDEKDFDKED